MPKTQTIRQTIMSDESLEILLDKCYKMPRRVQKAADTLAEVQFAAQTYTGLDQAKERLEAVGAEMMFEIMNDLDPETKKPKYSNDTQRKGALAVKKTTSDVWLKASNDVGEATRKKYLLDMDVAKSTNTLKAVTNEYHMIGHLCDVVAGLSHEDHIAERLEVLARKEEIIGRIHNDVKELEGNHAEE